MIQFFQRNKTFSSLIFLWHGYCLVLKQMSAASEIRHLKSLHLHKQAPAWSTDLDCGYWGTTNNNIHRYQHNFIIIVIIGTYNFRRLFTRENYINTTTSFLCGALQEHDNWIWLLLMEASYDNAWDWKHWEQEAFIWNVLLKSWEREDEDDIWTVSTTNQSSCGHEQQETRNKLEQEEILQGVPKLLQEHFFIQVNCLKSISG